jgi:transcriptional regulator with XRE-family HTH domain
LNQVTRSLELRELLTRCRARLRPEDVGLPMTLRRRVPGLRREEVAELVAVTPKWYTTFENGSSERHFSSAFVQRVADALRLDQLERSQLFRLALPEIRLAVEQFERSTHDAALLALSKIRSLVRRVAAAGSFEEAVHAAVVAVGDVLSPTSTAAAILLPNGKAPRLIGAQRTSDGRSFFVYVGADSPSASEARAVAERTLEDGPPLSGRNRSASLSADDYWEWNSKLEARSVLTHGLFANGRYRGNLCALWTAPREMGPVEIEALRTASAVVELAAARESGAAMRTPT